MSETRRRTGAVTTCAHGRLLPLLVLTVVWLGVAPTAAAQTSATATGPELTPATTDRAHPFAGAQLPRNSVKGTRSISRPPAAVSARRYAREKADAERRDAPLGAETPLVAGPGAEAPTAPLIFDGLTRPGAINNGFTFTPPDTTLAKSTNRIIEGANSALRLFTKAGSPIATLNLNSFFGAPTANGLLFDPKVFYDRNATNPRFFVVALQVAGRNDTSNTNNVSRIWVAVSRSPDPTNLSAPSWCRYNFDGRFNTGTTNVSWADYPVVGVGRDSFSIGLNQFRFTDTQFTYALIKVLNKNVAENNAGSCPTIPNFTFRPSSTFADFSRFTLQPAQSYTTPSSFTGTTNPAYYLSTTRGSSNQYHVLRVRNVASGSPTLNQVTLTGASYSMPPDAPQPSSSVLVDTGDNRVLQVAGIGNQLTGIFTVLCNFTAGTPNESCTRTPRVRVDQTPGGAFTATLAENTFAGIGNNVYVHHPSIATNTALQSASNWESNGPGEFLRSKAFIKNVNAGWSFVSAYAPGACSLPAGNARSGDYSGAQLEPTNATSFWLAGERTRTINGVCQWSTRIANIVP